MTLRRCPSALQFAVRAVQRVARPARSPAGRHCLRSQLVGKGSWCFAPVQQNRFFARVVVTAPTHPRQGRNGGSGCPVRQQSGGGSRLQEYGAPVDPLRHPCQRLLCAGKPQKNQLHPVASRTPTGDVAQARRAPTAWFQKQSFARSGNAAPVLPASAALLAKRRWGKRCQASRNQIGIQKLGAARLIG